MNRPQHIEHFYVTDKLLELLSVTQKSLSRNCILIGGSFAITEAAHHCALYSSQCWHKVGRLRCSTSYMQFEKHSPSGAVTE